MKYRFLSALLVFVFAFSFASFAQGEEEEVELFSIDGTRGIQTNQHDFGVLKTEVAQYTISVKNDGNTDMYINYIKIPAGISVTVLNDQIKPNAKGELVVTVDPNLFGEGNFMKKILIQTYQKDLQGVVIKKEISYAVKGNVLK